jgi:transketolase C-terminal domain/subunit
VVLTAEEGTLTGGLSSLVGQAIAREGIPCRMVSAGVSGRLAGPVGSRGHMLARQGLDPASLADTALRNLKPVRALAA